MAKPPKKGYDQWPVGSAIPSGKYDVVANIEISLQMSSAGGGNRLIFEITQNASDPYKVVYREKDAGGIRNGNYFICILQDTKLNVKLKDGLDWKFNTDGTALTTKKDVKSNYGVDGEFPDNGNSVTLYCKARPGNAGKDDEFCFNVMMGQGYGVPIPITIDPDIKNPPPNRDP